MVGDVVLQTRWQAATKRARLDVRLRHVVVYCLPFAPIAFVYGHVGPLDRWTAGAVFLAWLAALHLLADGLTWRATLGDRVAWWRMPPERRADELAERAIRQLKVGDYHSEPALIQIRPSVEQAARARVPENPWPPIPILVDQAVHLCQLALLGGLFLR